MRAVLFSACFQVIGATLVLAGPITNPGFEDPVLGPEAFLNGSAPGWTGSTVKDFYFGITSQAGLLPPIPEGSQVAFVNNFATPGGTPTSNAIAQQLGGVLEANRAYILSASFGWRFDNSESRGTLELWSGGTVSEGIVTGGTLLASKSVKLAKGQFVRESVTFLSLPPWDHLGEKLSVRLVGTPIANTFAQTNFDDVHLLVERLDPCQSDNTRDSVVDDVDFVNFLSQYNAYFCNPVPLACTADLNYDGFVDDADFSIFVVAYNEYLCPPFTPRMRPVSQNRSVLAHAGANSNSASAPDYNPFSRSVNASAPSGSASAQQTSALGEFGFSVDHSASAGGQGGPSSNSNFSYVFDLDYQAAYTLNPKVNNVQVAGSFVGPNISLDLTFPGPFSGTLSPGRYTVNSQCFGGGGGGGSGSTKVEFILNQLP